MLTGREVFEVKTIPALLVAHAGEQPVPPSQRCASSIPLELENLVLDCLTKDPEERVQNATALVSRLRRIELEQAWSQKRAERWWARFGDVDRRAS